MDTEPTPYQKGYRQGKAGKIYECNYLDRLDKVAYNMGFVLGIKDREKE